MEALRHFLKVDNHCAVEVGQLSEGTRPFQVRTPKFKEGCVEEAIREGPEESTLRAEEGSQKACMNVGHIAEDRWETALGAIYKGIEGSEWEELYDYFEEMSKAAGVKKPNGSQKPRALWRMKAARDSGTQSAKTTFLGRNATRLELWEEHLKDPIVALEKALKWVENPY